MELDTVRCSTPLGFCSVKIIRPGYKQSSLLLGASLMNKKSFVAICAAARARGLILTNENQIFEKNIVFCCFKIETLVYGNATIRSGPNAIKLFTHVIDECL